MIFLCLIVLKILCIGPHQIPVRLANPNRQKSSAKSSNENPPQTQNPDPTISGSPEIKNKNV